MSENYNEGRRDGLAEAARHLREAAADFRRAAAHVEIPAKNHFSHTAAMIRKDDSLGKAILLEFKAEQIEGLK